MKITQIATHKSPHLDEIAGIWLLQEFGREKYPGIISASLEFYGSDNDLPKNESTLLLGIGSGKFDEHKKNSEANGNGDCVATLVAKDLGLDEDPALEPILKFVRNVDQKGVSHPFDISSVVKDMHLHYPDAPEMAINWAMQALNAKYRGQSEFLDAKEELEKAKIEELRINDKVITMVITKSDNKQFSKFARSSLGANADVIVQKNSSGNVQIFTDRRGKARIDLEEVVKIVRVEEQYVQRNIVVTDWNVLASEGVVDGIPEWFYHKDGQMLLNGSLTKTGITPTRIPFAKLVEFVKIGIDPEYFPAECNGWCIKQKCNSYKYGRRQCKKLRSEIYARTRR